MSNAFLSTNTTAIEEGKLKLAIRDGVELEKGVVITEEYLKQHEDLFIKYAEFFTAYPDLYLDMIKPVDSNFDLFFSPPRSSWPTSSATSTHWGRA